MLKDLIDKWIRREEKIMQELLDLMTLEQFLWDPEKETQQWVRRHQLCTMDEALKITEDFATKKEGDAPTTPGGGRTKKATK